MVAITSSSAAERLFDEIEAKLLYCLIFKNKVVVMLCNLNQLFHLVDHF